MALEALFEDRFDPLVRAGSEGERPPAGRFEPFLALAFAQPHDP
jgi:hypothetical protein